MADANKRKRGDGGIFTNYAEVIFYECMFSAQFTGNIQLLFRIDDIVRKLPPSSFAANFPDYKRIGIEAILDTVATWKKTTDPVVSSFFEANDLSKATSVIVQKNSLTATIDDKTVKLPLSENVSRECIMAAIDLLRYPFLRMEAIQRGRAGRLLDLEKDAELIMTFHDGCPDEGDLLKHWIDILSNVEKKQHEKKKSKKVV